jgi:hypothetical protein
MSGDLAVHMEWEERTGGSGLYGRSFGVACELEELQRLVSLVCMGFFAIALI